MKIQVTERTSRSTERKAEIKQYLHPKLMVLMSCFLISASSFAQSNARANSRDSAASSAATAGVKSGYAPVNGLKIYYEIHGTGEPLVLLHGGLGAIEMFGSNMQALAAKRQVIGVDLQGHGRTAGGDRPMTFEAMADDIVALLKYLGIEKADIMGYSLGGAVALQTTIRHPEAVRKLVLVSTPFKREGWYPEMRTGMSQMGERSAAAMKGTPLQQLYASEAPKPEDWTKLHIKMGELLKKDYDWSEGVKAIKSPVMIIAGDADGIRPTHLVEFFALLGGGQHDAGWDGSGKPNSRLAILPGRTHYDIFMAPALSSVVLPFLEEPLPKK